MTATTPALPGPGGVAQLRYLRRLFRDPSPVLDELREAYGPVCALGAGPARMAVVGDPDALRDLFSASTDDFRWGHRFNVLGFVVGPGSMIVSDGPDHRRRRASVQGAFGIRRLQRWIPTIVDQTDEAVDGLLDHLGPEPEVVDLYPVGRRLVLHVVVRALFGPRLADRADEIGDLFQRPQDYLESPALRQLPHPLPWTARAGVRADRRALDAIIDSEIAERRRQPSGDPLDVLEVLVQDPTLSDAEVRDQVVTLIGAGYDTTAASLAWMLWRASLAPGVWASLRAEADEVLPPPGAGATDVGPDELRRLELADRVVRETLRLHPAGVLSPREAVADVPVGDHVIPRGTLVLWSAHLAGRDPQAWPDPLRFDPGRFEDLTDAQRAVADAAWVPFGRGARRCIGFALAQMELTLMIARLAQRLDVRPTADRPPPPVGMVVNRPSGGVPLRVGPRGGLDPAPATTGR